MNVELLIDIMKVRVRRVARNWHTVPKLLALVMIIGIAGMFALRTL